MRSVKVGVYVGAAAPKVGGGFTIVSETVRALVARAGKTRHQFTLITAAEALPGEGLPVLSLAGALGAPSLPKRVERRVRRAAGRMLGRPIAPGGDVPPAPAIDALLTADGIDVVWYLSAWDVCTLEVPYATVVWDLQHRRQPFFPEVSDDGKWAYRERWLSTVLRRAALVVAGTEAGRDEIESYYGVPRERIRLIPHPTPTFATEAKPSAAHPAVAGEYIFYPAQFWPHKNHINLLGALDLLRTRDGLDLRLVLTGSDKGNETFVRETATRLGLADHVHFLGFVSTGELASLYRHALALTYVTFFGPENLPPLEAFASGCPVVASDVAGAREQLGDAALLVDPRSPEQIADAVSSLRRDPDLRARLVERGAARALRSTPAHFVDAMESWLDDFEGVRRCWPPGAYRAAKGQFP
jgi:glycosyltransferase involved in cell wall biosynthesis